MQELWKFRCHPSLYRLRKRAVLQRVRVAAGLRDAAEVVFPPVKPPAWLMAEWPVWVISGVLGVLLLVVLWWEEEDDDEE